MLVSRVKVLVSVMAVLLLAVRPAHATEDGTVPRLQLALASPAVPSTLMPAPARTELEASGHTRRAWGIGLTLTAAAILALSVYGIFHSDPQGPDDDMGGLRLLGGIAGALVGTGLLSGGIVLWKDGQARINQAQALRVHSATPVVAATPGGGVVIGLRLTTF